MSSISVNSWLKRIACFTLIRLWEKCSTKLAFYPLRHRERPRNAWKKRLKMREKENDGLALLPKAEDFLEMPEKAHLVVLGKKSFGRTPSDGRQSLQVVRRVGDPSSCGYWWRLWGCRGAYFDHQETLNGYYQVLDQILENEGIPALSDRQTDGVYLPV